jgi:signal transduction histidine kinase
MRAGAGRTRAKLFAGLAVLGATWVFAAFATGSDAIDLFRARAAGEGLGQPTDAVVLALQEERRLSTGVLGGDGRQAALAGQRARTDEAYGQLRRSADEGQVRWAAGDDALARVEALLDRLASLGEVRDAVDGGWIGPEAAAATYTSAIDQAFQVYDAPGMWEKAQLADANALVVLARAREALAREDALVRGALATGDGLTAAERLGLAGLVSTRRFLGADVQSALPERGREAYLRLVGDSRAAALGALEQRLLQPSGTGAAVTPQAWSAAVDPVLSALRELEVSGARDAVEAAKPTAVRTILLAGLVGGLGLVAVVAVFVAGVRAARAARGTGRWPAPRRVTDPRTAQERARAEAERRLHGLLRDLDRRNQSLLHRQLRVLDAMERREGDDETLGDLFRADHLATRMRRNVEKAITLAGGTPGRRWRRPVPMIDVVRGAAAEVADFPRVSTSRVAPAALAGSAVTDVIHLLAELIENATAYAPAETRVRVVGEARDEAYAVVVADTGPGMDDDDLATAHEVIAANSPPAGGAWWGLYAVGRFADRHGIAVTLHRGETGGLSAEVLLPAALVSAVEPDQPAASGADAETGERASVGPRTTASGLPTRVRSAPAPAPAGRPTRPSVAAGAPPTDRVARLRERARASEQAAAEGFEGSATIELPAVDAPPRKST